jgi:acetyl esterase/lipase
MQVGDAEILLDDTRRVADKARAAGVEVTVEIYPEMVHIFQLFAPILPEGQQAIERIGAFIRGQTS